MLHISVYKEKITRLIEVVEKFYFKVWSRYGKGTSSLKVL